MTSLASSPTLNQASRTFRQLHDQFNACKDDPQVDVLAADLAAQIAAVRHPVCLGLFEPKKLKKIYSLTRLLLDYGVTLRSKRREVDGMVFVYGEIELPIEVQFVGSFVQEVPLGMAA